MCIVGFYPLLKADGNLPDQISLEMLNVTSY